MYLTQAPFYVVFMFETTFNLVSNNFQTYGIKYKKNNDDK